VELAEHLDAIHKSVGNADTPDDKTI
jgi:hypothetical protein